MKKVFIKINGVEKTNLIEWRSFRWEQNITNKQDSLSFRIASVDQKSYAPDPMDEVEVYIGDTLTSAQKVFGGHVVEVQEQEKGQKVFVDVKVRDYAFFANAKLVARRFENKTVAQIIETIKNDYLPSGYTTNNVNCDIVIPAISFNYMSPTDCFSELAKLTGYDWYIDENKDLHFFAKETYSAPVEIKDDNGSYIKGTLKVKHKIDQLRNSIFVRGSEYLSSDVRVEDLSHQADGVNTHFKLAYRYKNYTLKVNGQVKSVGIDNLDDPAGFDALYNFMEKVLKFKTPPAANDTVTFEGNIYIPLRIKWKDNASISKYGAEFQFLIIDRTIDDLDLAKDRARAEILAYSEQLNDGGFDSYIDGLKVGQAIRINSAKLGVNKLFTIVKVTARARTSFGGLVYSVTVADKQKVDLLDILQGLLTEKLKDIKLDDNEELVQVDGFFEQVEWQEAWDAKTYPSDSPVIDEQITYSEQWRQDPWSGQTPIYVAGPYYPADANDRKRQTFADHEKVAS